MTRSAYREAVTYFEQALGALQHLPESRDTRSRPSISASTCAARSSAGRSSSGSSLLAGAPRPSPSPRRSTSAGAGLCLSVSQFLDWWANMTAPSLLASAPWRSLQPRGGRPPGAGRTLTWAGLLRPGRLSRAVERLEQNVACLQGELLHERFGMPWLVSVVSRAYLPGALPRWARSPRGSPGRGRGADGRGGRSPLQPDRGLYGVGLCISARGTSPGHPGARTGLDLCQDAHIPALVPWVAAPLGRPMRSLGGSPRPAAAGAGGRAGASRWA